MHIGRIPTQLLTHPRLRGPLHPPKKGDPEGTKSHVTGYGINEEGKKKTAFHWNDDGTVDEWPVAEDQQ